MATISQHLLNFLFPITCSSCGKDLPADDYYRICASCRTNIKPFTGLFCQTCGIPLPDGGAHCYNCRKNAPKYHFTIIRSAAPYTGILKDLVLKFKYGNKDYLERFFSKLLIETFYEHSKLSEIDCVMPVPMHWLKKLRRGYNQSELLAVNVAAYLQKPLMNNTLKKTGHTRAQASLTKEERLKNLAFCFTAARHDLVKNKKILLIDDVCTTCSTIEQCSRILRNAGASEVMALTVARD